MGKSIIPSVKRRRPELPAWMFDPFGPLPEGMQRQVEINNRIEAEALALWRIEQKHAKRLEDKRSS